MLLCGKEFTKCWKWSFNSFDSTVCAKWESELIEMKYIHINYKFVSTDDVLRLSGGN